MGMYRICDELWDECVGLKVDVERLPADFAPDMQLMAGSVRRRETDPLVAPMLQSLEGGEDH